MEMQQLNATLDPNDCRSLLGGGQCDPDGWVRGPVVAHPSNGLPGRVVSCAECLSDWWEHAPQGRVPTLGDRHRRSD